MRYSSSLLAAKNVSVYPEGIKAKVGERVQFVCVVSGFGWNYTVKWYSISKPDDVLATINHTHVLDIPNIQLNDSGSYYCKVQDEHGSFASNSSILQVIGTSKLCVLMCMCTCVCVCVCGVCARTDVLKCAWGMSSQSSSSIATLK